MGNCWPHSQAGPSWVTQIRRPILPVDPSIRDTRTIGGAIISYAGFHQLLDFSAIRIGPSEIPWMQDRGMRCECLSFPQAYLTSRRIFRLIPSCKACLMRPSTPPNLYTSSPGREIETFRLFVARCADIIQRSLLRVLISTFAKREH